MSEYACLFVCLFLPGEVSYLAMAVQPVLHETTVSDVENKSATSKAILTRCSRLGLIDFLVVMRPDITKQMGEK